MRVISVINYKGGVGKTTLTANIAAELAIRGYKILVVDLDPQTNLTFSFVEDVVWNEQLSESKTIRNLFTGLGLCDFNNLIHQPQIIKDYLNKHNAGCVDIVASHLDLINVDLELASNLGSANPKLYMNKFVEIHNILSKGIAQIPAEKYDVILIDCPPNFNITTKNAIVASTDIIIPTKPDYLSTMGIEYLMSSIERLKMEYNDIVDKLGIKKQITPNMLGVIFTMVQYYRKRPIGAIRPYIAQTKNLNFSVFENMVRENKSLIPGASEYKLPIVLDKNNRQHHVIDEIECVVTELIGKISI